MCCESTSIKKEKTQENELEQEDFLFESYGDQTSTSISQAASLGASKIAQQTQQLNDGGDSQEIKQIE